MSLIGFKAKNHPQQTAKAGALDEVDDRGTKREYIDALETRFGGKFTLDVAAAAHNAKAETYYTRGDDGLHQPWSGRVWCNPPYSREKGVMDLGDWVQKAWSEWQRREEWLVGCSLCEGPATTTLNGKILGAEPMREERWCPARFVAKSHRIRHQDERAKTWLVSTRPELIAMLVPANRVEQAWWQDHVEPFRDNPDSSLRVEFQRGRMRFDMPPGWEKPEKGDRPPFGLALLIWSGSRRPLAPSIPPATTNGGEG